MEIAEKSESCSCLCLTTLSYFDCPILRVPTTPHNENAPALTHLLQSAFHTPFALPTVQA